MEDIEALSEYIARDSTHYAGMFAVKVFDAVERLELFPESGRIVPN